MYRDSTRLDLGLESLNQSAYHIFPIANDFIYFSIVYREYIMEMSEELRFDPFKFSMVFIYSK